MDFKKLKSAIDNEDYTQVYTMINTNYNNLINDSNKDKFIDRLFNGLNYEEYTDQPKKYLKYFY
jgi:hypothetical protein